MLILSIRTDKPEAEVGLFANHTKLAYEVWEAHRKLAESMHTKIQELLAVHHKNWSDIQGIICFQGPGSFTGLRIGLTVANALASSMSVPIVTRDDQSWLEQGITALLDGQNDEVALPIYGAPVHITKQKH